MSRIFSLLGLFVIVFLASKNGVATPWLKEEIQDYSQRSFITLEHLLISRHEFLKAHQMQSQADDLAGCRALHHGAGGISAVIQCMSFMNREMLMGIQLPSSNGIVRDINILCEKLAQEPVSLKSLVGAQVFKLKTQIWKPCLRTAWKQLYLTAYANFDANPVGTLALVRRAEKTLPPQEPWHQRVNDLLRQR
jgi:hypothetical protein